MMLVKTNLVLQNHSEKVAEAFNQDLIKRNSFRNCASHQLLLNKKKTVLWKLILRSLRTIPSEMSKRKLRSASRERILSKLVEVANNYIKVPSSPTTTNQQKSL